MSQPQPVTINGRSYDPATGLAIAENPQAQAPVAAPAAQSSVDAKPAVHSAAVHATTQKSQTLRRSSLTPPQPARTRIQGRPGVMDMMKAPAKSPQVTKFAPAAVPVNRPKTMDIGPVKHPVIARLEAKQAALTPVVKSAKTIKQEVIRTAIQNTVKQNKQHKRGMRHPRILSVVTTAVALVLLGGYLTYLNMPSLSVRVAAAAAGINASYPGYHPDGYQLNGPVAYSQGRVDMQFAAAAGPQNFTIKQTKSNWDSTAVLDNYVTPKAGTSYITYTDHGLTIYTFNNNAAWVNGGILYTIEGNAPLSSEQIRHIATSFI